MRTTGQERLHSWRHLAGLHLSVLTMAIRSSLEAGAAVGAILQNRRPGRRLAQRLSFFLVFQRLPKRPRELANRSRDIVVSHGLIAVCIFVEADGV